MWKGTTNSPTEGHNKATARLSHTGLQNGVKVKRSSSFHSSDHFILQKFAKIFISVYFI